MSATSWASTQEIGMGRYLVSSPVAAFISVPVKMVGTSARSTNSEGP